TLMEKALYYGEEITGLVVAAVLVLPSKKLSDLTPQTIINRFKEKAFARGVDRELLLKSPEELGVSLEKLAEIALESMKEISDDLGL
ncbi:MAG: phosphohydrolase, partial [Patescibacteria group bacterium]|nr:phosphohydrolase [Patescibacteria group bacterium]